MAHEWWRTHVRSSAQGPHPIAACHDAGMQRISPRLSSPLAPLVALTMLGCATSCGGAPPSSQAPSLSAGAYTLHEWGVVRGEAGDELRLSASAPPEEATYFFEPGAVVEKPILYFHVEGDTPVALRSLRVTVDDRIVEHWPFVGAPTDPRSVAWTGWTARAEHCEASGYPSAGEAPCDAVASPRECEAAGLRAHETSSSACLEREGQRANMLFYRSSTRVPPPLVLRLDGAGLQATHAGDELMADTLVVRVRGGAASMQAAPSPGSAITLAEPTEPTEHALRALREEMSRRGLDAQEIDAFWRAWETTLTGDPRRPVPPLAIATPPTEDAVEDLAEESPEERAPREQPPLPPADRVFYFLPPSTIEAMSRIDADPPPRRLVRVFAVIQSVPAR